MADCAGDRSVICEDSVGERGDILKNLPGEGSIPLQRERVKREMHLSSRKVSPKVLFDPEGIRGFPLQVFPPGAALFFEACACLFLGTLGEDEGEKPGVVPTEDAPTEASFDLLKEDSLCHGSIYFSFFVRIINYNLGEGK